MSKPRNHVARFAFTLEEFDYGYQSLMLELTVSYWPVPYTPAVMYLRNGDPGYPADGGGCEDITAVVKSATYNRTVDEAPDFTAAELVDVQRAFDRLYAADESLRSDIETHCNEDIEERHGDDDGADEFAAYLADETQRLDALADAARLLGYTVPAPVEPKDDDPLDFGDSLEAGMPENDLPY